MDSKTLGRLGEDYACEYLQKKLKYVILDRNYTTKFGEADIIAKYKKTIIFVEVKTRSNQMFGLPREAVTKHKQHKLSQIACEYLLKNKLSKYSVQFDVIEILENELTHITNAFDATISY